MRRNVLIIVFCLCAANVYAQVVQRKDTMPGFFVPGGALSVVSKPEKLPPVPQFNHQRAASVTTNANTKQFEDKREIVDGSNKKIKTKYENNESNQISYGPIIPDVSPVANENSRVEETESKAVNNITKSKLPTNIKTMPSWVKKVPPQNLKVEKIKTDMKENHPAADEYDDKLLSEVKKATKETSDGKVDQLFEEYLQDREVISRGEPYLNPNLITILNDYKDEDLAL